MIDARRIFCVGIDSCLSIAKEFNQRLKLVDLWTNVYSDNTLISKIPKVSTSRDVVVVFVLSRQLPTLSHEIFDANQRGVRVVMLTNVTQNPISLTELTKFEQLETPPLSWQTWPELMIALVSNIVCDTLKVTLHQEK